MKRLLPLALTICCAATAQQAEPHVHLGHAPAPAQAVTKTDAEQPQKPAEWRDYTGTLGAEQIGATLVMSGSDVTGSYFRVADLKDVTLREHTAHDDAELSLGEMDANGKPVAEIFLRRVAEPRGSRHQADPSEQYAGTWTSADRSKTLPVMLTLQDTLAQTDPANRYAVAGTPDAAAAEHNAQSFVAAVVSGNADDAAKYVAFPLAVTLNGKRTLVHSADDFRAKFGEMFAAAFVAEIHAAVPHHMFANEHGLMLGNGEVWFDSDGMAFALNNQPVKMFANRKFLSNKGYAPTPRKKAP